MLVKEAVPSNFVGQGRKALQRAVMTHRATGLMSGGVSHGRKQRKGKVIESNRQHERLRSSVFLHAMAPRKEAREVARTQVSTVIT